MTRRAASSHVCRAIRVGRRPPAKRISRATTSTRSATPTQRLPDAQPLRRRQSCLLPDRGSARAAGQKRTDRCVRVGARRGGRGRRLHTFERELQRKLGWLPVPDLDRRKRRSVLLRRRERRWRAMSSSSRASRSWVRTGTKTMTCMTRASKVASPPRTRRPRRAARAKAVSGPVVAPPVFDAPVERDVRGSRQPHASNRPAKPKPLTRAQKLAKALKVCGSSRGRSAAPAKRGRGSDMASRRRRR